MAALLASVHRVLNAEASRRSLAGQPRAQICAVLADAANRAFDLLEPAIGGYGIRAQPGSTGYPGDTGPASSIGRPGSIGQLGSR